MIVNTSIPDDPPSNNGHRTLDIVHPKLVERGFFKGELVVFGVDADGDATLGMQGAIEQGFGERGR